MVARENLWSICKSRPHCFFKVMSMYNFCTLPPKFHLKLSESRYISCAIKDIDSSLWYCLNLANYDWLDSDVFLMCFLPMSLNILTYVCVCVDMNLPSIFCWYIFSQCDVLIFCMLVLGLKVSIYPAQSSVKQFCCRCLKWHQTPVSYQGGSLIS